MIKKYFTALNQSTLYNYLFCINTWFRTQLEYCNTVWNLGYLTDMAKLEKVQRRVTRILPTLRNLSYEERLHHPNLPSLSYQQFRSDMLTTFQVLNGLNFLISLQLYTHQRPLI